MSSWSGKAQRIAALSLSEKCLLAGQDEIAPRSRAHSLATLDRIGFRLRRVDPLDLLTTLATSRMVKRRWPIRSLMAFSTARYAVLGRGVLRDCIGDREIGFK